MIRIPTIAALIFLIFSGCTTPAANEPKVGLQNAPIDPLLFSDKTDVGLNEAELRKALTRSQKVVFGNNYFDFYATLQTKALSHFDKINVPANQTCFTIRVETDTDRLKDGLMWDLYLKRVTYSPTRVVLNSYVFSPRASYPLTYNGFACADYVINPSEPLFLFVRARGLHTDAVRLEWTTSPNAR